MKEDVIQKLEEVVKQLTGKEIPVALSIPKDGKNGDWTSNIAFQLGKDLGISPLEAAQKVVSFLEENGEFSGILRYEAVKPGFINFYLSNTELSRSESNVLDAPENVGKTRKMEGRKVIIEFTDPNPFKEFHIGHLYTNTVGESLSRLFEAIGATVQRADYFGDVGMHVAKALWGLEEKFEEDNIDLTVLEEKPLDVRIEYFGQAYAKGAAAYEGNSQAAEEIKTLNKLIYLAAQKMWQVDKGIVPQVDYKKDAIIDEKALERVYHLYTLGRKWSLEYFETIYQRVGMKFQGYYPESIAGEKGYTLVMDHIKDGVFVEHDGAVIFPGKEHALHNRVFINSLGLPTYEAKELGLAEWKYEEFPYDFSIILTGNEINEYFKVLIKALSLVNPELATKTKHIGHGMVKLAGGKKMSSRTGQILAAKDVLDEAKDFALEKIKDQVKKSELNSDQQDTIVEQIGVGAIKYAFLKSSIGKDVSFSFEESVSFEGNAGPYVQYAYTRTQSILAKSEINTNYQILNTKYSPQPEEAEILRKLYHFVEIVEEAATTYSPNVVTEYLFELSQLFNNFYQKYRILNAPAEEDKLFRLGLTKATGIVLNQGLNLLGIAVPEKM